MVSWNESWVDKYESTWGIVEKFKYLNQVTGLELEATDKEIFNRHCGPLLERRTNTINTHLSYLGINKFYSFISTKVRFCSTCIRQGHHSYLHQFSINKTCPYHDEVLYSRCPNCNCELNYTTFFDSRDAYVCKCNLPIVDRRCDRQVE